MTAPDAQAFAPLRLYTGTALTASGRVIGEYSTSFSLACRTLPGPVRRDIAGIYALVRVADEVVDGTARAAGLDSEQVRAALDDPGPRPPRSRPAPVSYTHLTLPTILLV